MSPLPGDALITLARTQLDRLRAGQIDEFLAEEVAYSGACTSFAEGAEEGSDGERCVHELIALTTAISAELERLMGETSTRLSQLSHRRRMAGAYLASNTPAPVTERDV